MGPGYTRLCSVEEQKFLTNPNVTWDQIENYIKVNSKNPGINNYGFSKALLNSYSMALVKEFGSKILVSSISPGWVQTSMGGKSADLTPE